MTTKQQHSDTILLPHATTTGELEEYFADKIKLLPAVKLRQKHSSEIIGKIAKIHFLEIDAAQFIADIATYAYDGERYWDDFEEIEHDENDEKISKDLFYSIEALVNTFQNNRYQQLLLQIDDPKKARLLNWYQFKQTGWMTRILLKKGLNWTITLVILFSALWIGLLLVKTPNLEWYNYLLAITGLLWFTVRLQAPLSRRRWILEYLRNNNAYLWLKPGKTAQIKDYSFISLAMVNEYIENCHKTYDENQFDDYIQPWQGPDTTQPVPRKLLDIARAAYGTKAPVAKLLIRFALTEWNHSGYDELYSGYGEQYKDNWVTEELEWQLCAIEEGIRFRQVLNEVGDNKLAHRIISFQNKKSSRRKLREKFAWSFWTSNRVHLLSSIFIVCLFGGALGWFVWDLAHGVTSSAEMPVWLRLFIILGIVYLAPQLFKEHAEFKKFQAWLKPHKDQQ